ncbi:MAG: aspartate dehydrogenase [Pseudomonadota bacterium]
MNIGIIGVGAIGRYVHEHLTRRGHAIRALLVRPERVDELATDFPGAQCVGSARELPGDLDLIVDCAGQAALRMHGPEILRSGIHLVTVSIGALADAGLCGDLESAAIDGNARLLLASGAIGALDCLQAGRVGTLHAVTYSGRKPPRGWKGSPAEERLDLDSLTDAQHVHFEGSARDAARRYPKNANVAAAVALAGVGMDDTHVRLIADPTVDQNIHEVIATGEFGEFTFEIRGNALPDNPRSSALAAMSAVSRVEQETQRVRF